MAKGGVRSQLAAMALCAVAAAELDDGALPLCSPATQQLGRRQEWEAQSRGVDGERGSDSGRGERLPLLRAVCEQSTGGLFACVFSLTSVAAIPHKRRCWAEGRSSVSACGNGALYVDNDGLGSSWAAVKVLRCSLLPPVLDDEVRWRRRSSTMVLSPSVLRRRSSLDDVKNGKHRAAALMVSGEFGGSGASRRRGPVRHLSPFEEAKGSGASRRRALAVCRVPFGQR
nr:hypothetical protein Iba_chr09aCG12310 [Ipomoea batatas]